MEIIATVDAEDLVRRWLAEMLGTDVAVYCPPSPAKWPARSVLVTRTGGTMSSLVVDQAQLTIECRAPTPAQAATLAGQVRDLMAAARREPTLCGVTVYGGTEMSAPYPDPDPDNNQLARWTQTSVLRVRATRKD